MVDVSRRAMIKAAGAVGAAVWPAALAVADPPSAEAQSNPPLQPTAYAFFNSEEAAFVEAAVARLIPSEGKGPGAIEAGVPNFLDKQLGGAWGAGMNLFLGGPFDPNAVPQLGYQLPYTPAQLFRRAIGAINRQIASNGQSFAAMPPQEQDAFLREQLEGNGLGDLDGVPAKTFFAQLLELTVQGYFCDPVYGGNKDMVAWRAIGFPGAYASYYDTIDMHGAEFCIGPHSLAEHDKIPDTDMKSMNAQE
jgi:gluconate 2-dehydrogenase gamma chain